MLNKQPNRRAEFKKLIEQKANSSHNRFAVEQCAELLNRIQNIPDADYSLINFRHFSLIYEHLQSIIDELEGKIPLKSVSKSPSSKKKSSKVLENEMDSK